MPLSFLTKSIDSGVALHDSSIPLGFQAAFLLGDPAESVGGTQFPPDTDHLVAGIFVSVGILMQGVSDGARPGSVSRHVGQLTVGYHAPAGDCGQKLVELLAVESLIHGVPIHGRRGRS